MVVGLPNAGPSATQITGFDGRTRGAQAKTVMPYNLTKEHLGGEILYNRDLHNNLASAKKMADAGLVCIFHPEERDSQYITRRM